MSDGVCYVYWIHLPEHTDVFTQGYVGFTSATVERRVKEHVYLAKKKPKRTSCARLYHSINKHGIDKFIVETLCVCDKEYGLWLENKLRPEERIGLNIAVGGSAPMLGRKRDPAATEQGAAKRRGAKLPKEHCENISKGRKGLVHSELHRKRISETLTGRKIPKEVLEKRSATIRLFKHHNSHPCVWILAEQVFTVWVKGEMGCRKIARLFDTTHQRLFSMLSAFKSGWNPSEDQEYLAWREAYLEEQRKEPNGT